MYVYLSGIFMLDLNIVLTDEFRCFGRFTRRRETREGIDDAMTVNAFQSRANRQHQRPLRTSIYRWRGCREHRSSNVATRKNVCCIGRFETQIRRLDTFGMRIRSLMFSWETWGEANSVRQINWLTRCISDEKWSNSWQVTKICGDRQ